MRRAAFGIGLLAPCGACRGGVLWCCSVPLPTIKRRYGGGSWGIWGIFSDKQRRAAEQQSSSAAAWGGGRWAVSVPPATTLDIVSEQTKESRGLEGMSQKRNKAMLRRGAGANGERKEPCSKAEKASGGVREVRDCGDMGCSGEAGV